MDPKTLPTLDPKLKEAYDRVMSTSLTPPPAATPTTPPPASPGAPTPAAATPPQAPAPAAPAAQVATPHYTTVPLTGPQPVSSPSTHPTTFVARADHGVSGQKSKISPVLLLVLGLIFFAVYTLFWLRFFNVTIPFIG